MPTEAEQQSSTASAPPSTATAAAATAASRARLRGRAFYESIGSPKYILAPMVDQSEFAWRLLTRSYLAPHEHGSLLAYTPMFHARLFAETKQFRDMHFRPTRAGLAEPLPRGSRDALTPRDDMPVLHDMPDPCDDVPILHDYLDGRADVDRPLTVQFCANDPDELLAAARYVQPYCDAVDLNLGCPQGIAKRGHYGAFLQEDWDLVASLIGKLNRELHIPVTAKIRRLETKEKTLEYARRIVDAGASILTVHGRVREQKGHLTGLADWSFIRYLRDNLPRELVMFANGNILRHEDIQRCLDATGVDGVMSAEGNLSDPTVFAAPPPPGEDYNGEYWRGRDGRGGFRMDAVFRRYLDIIHRHVVGKEPPQRKPLFQPSDAALVSNGSEPAAVVEDASSTTGAKRAREEDDEPDNGDDGGGNNDSNKAKKRKKKKERKADGRKMKKTNDPNFTAIQPHLFRLLRPLVSVHTDVRDALARARGGDIEAYEHVLALTEEAVRQGLIDYGRDPAKFEEDPAEEKTLTTAADNDINITDHDSSLAAVRACRRPYWVCQPYVRPLPKEAVEKGALSLSAKTIKTMQKAGQNVGSGFDTTEDGAPSEDCRGNAAPAASLRQQSEIDAGMGKEEIAGEAMVAG